MSKCREIVVTDEMQAAGDRTFDELSGSYAPCMMVIEIYKATSSAAPQTEITPAMISAGMEEYSSRWLGLRDADDAVAAEMLTAAYRAMFQLRP